MTLGPRKNVIWTGFEPSLSHTQISQFPERFDVNAILLPSGENSGAESSRVEEMKGVSPFSDPALFTLFVFEPPGAVMRQILEWIDMLV